MLNQIGPVELIVVLVIVLLLFGPGRIARVGREVGETISEFRQGMNEGKEDQPTENEEAV